MKRNGVISQKYRSCSFAFLRKGEEQNHIVRLCEKGVDKVVLRNYNGLLTNGLIFESRRPSR